MAKPKIRFQGYTEDWEQRKFGDLFSRRMERNLGQFDNTRWISVAKMYFQNPDKVTSNNIDTRTYVMHEGDIAFEGHTNQEYRFGRFVANDIGDGVISELFPIYQHITSYDNNYWKYAIQIEAIMAPKLLRCIEISYTSSNKLDEKFFLEEYTMVPTIEEQQKIGAYFTNLDHLITLHQRKCDETKKFKKFMLQKMFPKDGKKVPEIRFEGFTEEWEQRKLSDYLEVSKQKNRSQLFGKEDVLSVSGKFGIVNQIEFQGRSFAGASVANYGVVEAGDVVYTKSPLKSNPYGIIKTNKGKTGIVSTLYAVYKPKNDTDSEFVQIYFESDFRMNTYMQPLVNKGAKNDMKVSDENALKGSVAFPKIEEQRAISRYFSHLDHLITLHQRKCDKLQEIKKYMLQNMFI